MALVYATKLVLVLRVFPNTLMSQQLWLILGSAKAGVGGNSRQAKPHVALLCCERCKQLSYSTD
jgi:hypothetical protein